MISWDPESLVLWKTSTDFKRPGRLLIRSLQARVFWELMCHELEGLFHRSPSGITSDLAISLPRPSPSFLAIILEVVNANVVIFPFSGGVWSMSSWRAVSQQHLLGALFPNAAQNRIIEAVSVRAWYGRRHRSRTLGPSVLPSRQEGHGRRFARPPWSPTVPRVSPGPFSSGTVTKRHDANAGFPRQHPLS